MNSDNLNINDNSFLDQPDKFELFKTNEIEVLQFLAIQVENVLAPILQRHQLYYYIQTSNEFADKVFKNATTWCSAKRSEQ